MNNASPESSPLGNHSGGKKLTIRILIGMGLGIFLGLLINQTSPAYNVDAEPQYWTHLVFSDGLFNVAGQIFVRLLQVVVVPLVFVSLVCGTAALDDIRKLGRIGLKTVVFYLFTTAVAITIAIAAALLVRPGSGEFYTGGTYQANKSPPLVQVIIDLFPQNIVQTMAEGKMLPLIVFAVIFGIAVIMSGDAGKRILSFFEDLNEIIMKLVWIVMELAPYGVLGLIARNFAIQGFDAFLPIAKYFMVVIGVLLFQVLLVYPSLLKLLGGLNPVRFLRKMREVHLFAFSTASSNATLPITLETAETKLGIRESIASFTLPLGATINMDGTAIMQGVATIFISQAYNIPLEFSDLLMVVLTATLASIGTAGVPSAGMIMLAIVLKQVGLPVDGIALIIGIDRLLDMVRTAVNVTGDCAVSCIVAKSEGEFDEATYNASID